MRRRLALTLAALAAIWLVAGAVPAFTADTGTINLSVTAQPPSEPCLQITNTNVSFGTAPFSGPGLPSSPGANFGQQVSNCGTSVEQVLIQGNDATGPSATWALITDRTRLFCNTGSRNEFTLRYGLDSDPVTRSISKTASAATSLLPAGLFNLTLELTMPCAGSDGAGDRFTTSIVLTAVL